LQFQDLAFLLAQSHGWQRHGLLTNEIENDFQFHHMNPTVAPYSLDETRESRCHCGNLLARLRPEGVELKCRRCKRVILIPWGTSSTWHGITVQLPEVKKDKAD